MTRMNSLLQSTWTALTWRKMLLMQALGQFAIFAQSLEGKLFGSWLGHQSLGYASMALNVCLILPAALFADAGFTDVGWKAIRKRNSKKELFEYVVHAAAPKDGTAHA